jgi:hypothetical protein
MKANNGCQIQTLATSEACSVTYCPDCGIFYVGIGIVTLRFRLAVLHLVASTLATALNKVKKQHSSGRAAVVPFRKPGDQPVH